MKRKTTFLKTLLVAAGLCAGVSASWGETTTLLEYGTNDVAWTTEGLATWTAGGTPTITDNSYVRISGGNGSYETSKTISPTANAIINVTAVWRGRSNTGRAFSAGNGSYFRFGNIVVAQNDQDQKHGYVFTGLNNIKNVTTFTAGSYRTDDTAILLIEAEINTASNMLTSFTIKSEDGAKTYVNLSDQALESADYTTVAFGYCKSGSVSTSNFEDLKSIKITETPQVVEVCGYTIKYQDMDGNTLKADDDTRSGVVGDPTVVTAADKEAIYTGGKKWIYNSDNSSSVTIAADGSSVVIVKFEDAGKYAYTLNAVDADKNILKELASGEQFGGDNVKVYYTKAFKLDGKYYSTPANGAYPYYAYTFTEAATKDITYSENATMSYFFEVEDLGKSHSWAATGAQPDRYSNGKAGRLYQNSYAYTEPLEGGVYTLTMWARNNSSSSAANMDIYVRDAEGNDGSVINFAEAWAKSGQGEKTIENITIPTGSYLVFNNGTNYNSNLEMDYIILVKTGEAPAVTKSVTMGANGYATFASKNALDLANLPAGLKAYTATLSGKTLSFNAKDDAAVAAGTGLLLKGDAGESYDIPVAATGAAVAGNALTGVTTATSLQSNAEGNYIFVMKKASTASDELTFLPLSTENAVEIPAGKAYVSVPASAFAGGAKSLAISFDDDATGISAAELLNNRENNNTAIFNLAGQRVAQPTKGLYIVGGKKVVVK